jgi:pimeloyl-ACP methyl ester carboxylesterase
MTAYNINGRRIFVREEGPSQGQVALLIHGWSSSWFALSPLLPYVGRRYRSIAVDLPGYGNSPPLPTPVTISAYADLLADLIRQLSDGPAVLIGHSMGGMISVTMALRHPELVERMILLCPTISGRLSTYIDLYVSPITHLERFTVGSKLSSLLESQFVSITDRIMRPALFAARSGITERDYLRIRADARRPGQGRVRAECYWAMRANDLSGRLANVEAPTLVIWGAEDNTVPLRDASLIDDEWPAADLRILTRAGHWPQFEAPDITQRHIATFLGLPLTTLQIDRTVGKTPEGVGEIAHFLQNSDIGADLNETQRIRLAAQFNERVYPAGAVIAQTDEPGSHLFIVQQGSIDVLYPPTPDDEPRLVATLLPGQLAGELALLDAGQRSADLRAGPDGATLLSLRSDRLIMICEEDPEMGTRLMRNIAATLARRLRLLLKSRRALPLETGERVNG